MLAALALSACGGGNVGAGTPATSATPVPPTASAPDAKAPPPDATQPGTAPLTTPTTAVTQPPPAGGAQDVRVPATFTAEPGGRLSPPTVTVPPFLAIEISLRSNDGRPHRLEVRTAPVHVLRVPAGGRVAIRIAGLRAGRYTVLLDGRRAAALLAGGDAGP